MTEAVRKKPYRGQYPSAARFLMEEGVTSIPRQSEVSLRWATGVDIVYTLKNMTPANFARYADSLLLLAYQEAMRYNEYKWKFAGFDVRLGRMKKGRDLPEIVTYQAAMHFDPEVMVYGPGYDVPQRHFLKDKVEDILALTKKYRDKVSKQNPYRVIRLFIKIREPR